MRTHYEFKITLKSYTDVADEFKKRNNLTWKEVGDRLRQHCQAPAWSDAYDAMQAQIDWENSDAGKEYIASINKQTKRMDYT